MCAIDIDKYNIKPKLFGKLTRELYESYPEITLSQEYAQFIHENLLQFLVRLARYKFVARLVKENDDILEIGCGSGLGAIFLGQHSANVTGLEVKKYELDMARKINLRKNVTFLEIDFFEYNSSVKYDVVVAIDVIEHMTNNQAKKLIAKMCKHLKRTGMAIIGTPSKYSYKFQSKVSRASHVKCYDQKELVNLVEKHFGRTLAFSMNDEIVHTGFPKMAWYYFVLGFVPKVKRI